jgi:PBP1b-binding outer membrane lipoprotein LpoB
MATASIKSNQFFLSILLTSCVNYKMEPEEKIKDDPADTSLKEDLSIDITFDHF